VVNEIITPDFQNSTICENDTTFTLPTTSPNGIEGTWSPATINFTTGGTYTFIPNSDQCATNQTIEITITSATLPTFTWQVNEPFADNSTITILPSIEGNYGYQLDFGPIQNSNVFTNVSSGLHTITIYDPNGCAEPFTINDILVIKYPKFFTPNNDGYNDTWNISDLFFDTNSLIYIFDRYGKLIKQIFPNGEGWDGRYNNNEMPSTDYWFSVIYEIEGIKREFKAHFSLKR
jgi:gliding motility-associated-like protein